MSRHVSRHVSESPEIIAEGRGNPLSQIASFAIFIIHCELDPSNPVGIKLTGKLVCSGPTLIAKLRSRSS